MSKRVLDKRAGMTQRAVAVLGVLMILWMTASPLVAQWEETETWSGTTDAPTEWQLVESWTGTISAPAASGETGTATYDPENSSGAGELEEGHHSPVYTWDDATSTDARG